MATSKTPARVKDEARTKLGTVAGILSQSQVVVASFGRGPGFILMMTGMLVVLFASLATILALAKGLRFL